MMIMVPSGVPESLVVKSLEVFHIKRPGAPISGIRYESLNEGLVVWILHVGPYDAEGANFGAVVQRVHATQVKRSSSLVLASASSPSLGGHRHLRDRFAGAPWRSR